VTSRKPPNAGKGRPKGSRNKITKALKEAILEAAEGAHPEGTVGYLRQQAAENPTAFMALLGKTLPMQHTGEDGGPLVITWQQPSD
jgi:proteasome lid subunit RPN8/RPN11